MSKLHVCTNASHQIPALEQLLESCRANGIHLDVLGLGEPFSFGKKLNDYLKYLEGIPPDDVVLFIDAYDVLILADEKTILEKFFLMNAPFVISVETNCFPFAHLAPYYPPSPTKFKYLNVGSYIGYANHIQQIYEDLSPIPDDIDDQGLLTVYFLKYPEKFKLDYHCELFLTLFQVTKKELVLDRQKKIVKSLTTGTEPCLVHGNGPAKVLYQKIYDTLFTVSRKKDRESRRYRDAPAHAESAGSR